MTQELDPGKFTKVIERSIQSNRFCFIELAKQLGNLTDLGTTPITSTFSGFEYLQRCTLRSGGRMSPHVIKQFRRNRQQELVDVNPVDTGIV